MEIKNLQPSEVFANFYELSRIPRESGNEKGVSDFLVQFAKDRKLEVIQDEALNVIIRKKASKGYEDRPTVALQGHMDMVCVKEDDSDHDFEKDPIELKIEDGWLTANGTTLGGDDGIGVAFIMGILDDDSLEHGPIEAIITTGEETSMVGANAIDLSQLKAKYLINIDSEEEGVLTIGCAGGLDLEIEFKKEYEKAQGDFIEINLAGFEGGHSGMEIDKFRCNAIKNLARLLHNIEGVQIADIKGGVKRNAIPTTAYALVSVKDRDEAITEIEKRIGEILNEYKDSDPKGTITVKKAQYEGEVISQKASKDIIDAIFVLPDGLYKKYKDNIVTSSNLGLLENREDTVMFHSMIRSEVDSAKANRAEIAIEIIKRFGGSYQITNQYSGWQREESSLIGLANETWKQIHGDDLIIGTTHGGLECGLFKKEIPHVEMISFGPEIEGAHSPAERCNIQSVANNYKFLVELLKKIK
ncbi:beta-Ala-His dipeptidase [Anaerococcus tetradius]|uniref:Cytosol non-specific dipeptidase n=1 Tax=Anaerococcus tetradius ATCC 35098 TaxID=525255 RepID=C2CIN1_9FIRM|nr:beta-Ala-His dipeptidase [Anaerococcus tetradius]EEI82627.1 Xaa-His dipeptidase [Anaerococcus tetradius ATCC 35098]